MVVKRQLQFSPPKQQVLIIRDPDPNPEEMQTLDIEALSDEEVFWAIRYLDPELGGLHVNQLQVVSDEAVFLTIQYLDPDFN